MRAIGIVEEGKMNYDEIPNVSEIETESGERFTVIRKLKDRWGKSYGLEVVSPDGEAYHVRDPADVPALFPAESQVVLTPLRELGELEVVGRNETAFAEYMASIGAPGY